MIERPRLKAHLRAHVVAPEEVFLLGDDRRHRIEGREFALVVPLLDGELTAADLAERLDPEVPDASVLVADVLARLDAAGHLADGNDHPPEAAWWEAAGLDSAHAGEAVAAARVVVHTAGDVPDADTVVSVLHWCGLDAVDSRAMERAGDLPLLLVEDYLWPGAEDFDLAMRAAGRPWVLAKAQGESLWIGPHLRPGVSACLGCVTAPLAGERPVESYIRDRIGEHPRHPAATAPGGTHLAATMLARELQEIAVTGRSTVLDDTVLVVGRDLRTVARPVVRRPGCPDCGAEAGRR
jgi:oxazoline/thiazoline synthase